MRVVHRAGRSTETTSRPSGSSDIGMSLKLASPSGRPMIVRHSRMPVTRCASASHQPHSSSHRTLPIADGAPAPLARTTVLPKGHSAKPAIRSDAMPKGIVMMRMKQMSAAIE